MSVILIGKVKKAPNTSQMIDFKSTYKLKSNHRRIKDAAKAGIER